MARKLDPIHPGEILLEEFLKPLSLTAYATAKALGIPRTRIERLIRGVTSVTPDTALRLERAFGSSAEFWMNLQSHYDLDVARGRASGLAEVPRLVAAE
ncbi:MAG: HigA family addiction module antitoxin [Caulobacterales bacterium]